MKVNCIELYVKETGETDDEASFEVLFMKPPSRKAIDLGTLPSKVVPARAEVIEGMIIDNASYMAAILAEIHFDIDKVFDV